MTSLAALAAATASADTPPLSLSPQAGTPDASPATQISVYGRPASTIRSVTATGSVSGGHSGEIKPYSDTSGASFVPDTPFAPGETVSVTVDITKRPRVNYSFTVGRLIPNAAIPTLNLTATQPAKLEHFVTRPDLLPPKITVSVYNPREKSNIFLTPLPSPTVHPGGPQLITLSPVGPGGPLMLDNQGRVRWFKQLPSNVMASVLEPARYENTDVLTWWEGTVKALAYGVGKGVIADRSYNTIAEVTAGNGYAADIHEFKVDNNGDALIAIYQPIIPEGWTPTSGEPRLIDAIIQRIDIKTGLVKWEWHALGNIPIEDGQVPPTNGFLDPFHINSIEGQKDGTVITSMRDTCAIYNVDEETGQIVWTLGGNSSSFAMGPGATFCFQHDARMLSKNRISLFDDKAGPPVLAQTSRGLILNLDTRRMTATVANEYVRPQDTLANSEGSVQKLKDGDVFVGFGSEPNFSQFSFDGTMNFDAALPVDDGSYRALRGEWDAKPQTAPDAAAVRTSPSHVTVYASWNGATRVASWRVLAGNSANRLSPAGAAAWSGFETSIPVSTTADTFKVQALNANGRVLATSAAAIAP